MNEELEMVNMFFSYEKRICRGLIATYTNCVANRNFGRIREGTFIDEIMIDYTYGKMELSNDRQLLDTYTIDLFINEGIAPEPVYEEQNDQKYTEEMLDQPKEYVDAAIALAMIEQNMSTVPQPSFGAPDLSGTFGDYIEENRKKDGLPPSDN